MSNTMAINKKVILGEDWTDSDFITFVNQLATSTNAVNRIFHDPNLVVDSIVFDITVNVRQAEQESLKLDDDFWVSVANGEYNE